MLWTLLKCVRSPLYSVNADGHFMHFLFFTPRWYFWCDTSHALDVNVLAHKSHINFCFSSCLAAQCLKSSWQLSNSMAHSTHLFSSISQPLSVHRSRSTSSCVIWCDCRRWELKVLRCTNPLPQNLQLKSFCPLCFFMCVSNKLQIVNLLEQPGCLQAYFAVFRCCSSWCSL